MTTNIQFNESLTLESRASQGTLFSTNRLLCRGFLLALFDSSQFLDAILLAFLAAIALFTGFVKAGLPALGALISATVALMFPPKDALGITQWALTHPEKIRGTSGVLAGITTTIGNAAGPILSLYLLLLKVDKHSFTGTAAIFFFCVNFTKLPIYGALGIFKDYYLTSYLLTAPLIFAGAYAGRKFLVWIPQKSFNLTILVFTGLAGLSLIIRPLF